MKHRFTFAGKTHELDLIPTPDGYRVTYQGREHTLTDVELIPGGVRFRLDGVKRALAVSHAREAGGLFWVAFAGRAYSLQRQNRPARAGTVSPQPGAPAPPHPSPASERILRAPMPGQIRAVNVQPGDTVAKGQTLLLLEAMKMEIRIQAPADGTVAKIAVKVGEQVEKEQILIEIGD